MPIRKATASRKAAPRKTAPRKNASRQTARRKTAPPAQPLPLTTEGAQDRLEDTLALCLSGGGYRAMLFHLGAIWYLNDARYLPELARVSTVSGASITAAVLATRWKDLQFEKGRAVNFEETVVLPIRELACNTIDVGSMLSGILLPTVSINDRVITKLATHLFGDATLQDFVDEPRFVINATNVQTGSLFRFSKPYLADWRIGRILKPKTRVAVAVAASAAFPPLLSPARLATEHDRWTDLNTDYYGYPPFTTNIMLTDGGVYDNMGIETAWKRCKRVLVCDAGGTLRPDQEPRGNWIQHSVRITLTIDNQVRSLRKRQIVAAFLDPRDPHNGAYWGMGSDPANYSSGGLPVDAERAQRLANLPTRLARLPNPLQRRLINFGYAMTDRAIRTHVDAGAFAPTQFPYPEGV
jgi:NTE family protein